MYINKTLIYFFEAFARHVSDFPTSVYYYYWGYYYY